MITVLNIYTEKREPGVITPVRSVLRYPQQGSAPTQILKIYT